MSDFWVQDGETMLLIGDSITDCGRRGAEMPLGSGYVRLFTEMVTAGYPDRRVRYINKGIGGNRVTHLRDRWTDDVLYNKPDRLSVKIGINDLHSVLRNAEDAVPVDLFEETYDTILGATQEALGIPVVLITPFYISTERDETTLRGKVNAMIPDYIAVVERMREKYDTLLVNLHDIFQNHLKYRDSEHFCPEPVHPNRAGHLVIAEALYAALRVA